MNLPDPIKTALTVAGVAGGIYAVYKLTTLGRTGNTDYLPTNGCRPSYREGWYNAAADSISQATIDIGTDEDQIYRVFADLKTDCDFIYLFNAFGIRTYAGGIFPTPYWSGNIVQFLVEELTASERDYLNSILHHNGLTYRV